MEKFWAEIRNSVVMVHLVLVPRPSYDFKVLSSIL